MRSLHFSSFKGTQLSRTDRVDFNCHRPAARRHLLVRALTSNDIRPGTTIEFDGAPWRVLEFLHVKPGKGAAFVRSKLRNYVTGNVLEKTFRAGETLQSAQIEKRDSQFSYTDAEEIVFMDNDTYEETRLKRDESWAKWIREGDSVSLISWNGIIITVDVPKTVALTITQTDPGVKGNTASGGSKPATLETGAVVQVPLFISEGETIRVDTRTDEYLGRGSS